MPRPSSSHDRVVDEMGNNSACDHHLQKLGPEKEGDVVEGPSSPKIVPDRGLRIV